jgi:hypothetical protein
MTWNIPLEKVYLFGFLGCCISLFMQQMEMIFKRKAAEHTLNGLFKFYIPKSEIPKSEIVSIHIISMENGV